MSFVLIDIDHTLSDAAWRDPMIGGEGGWDAYHAASISDEAATDIVALADAMKAQGHEVIGLTARPEKWRKLTMEWMLNNRVFLDEILMRPDEAFHPAPELKMTLARERFGEKLENVLFVLDDRDDVAAVFRGAGITVLQVHGRKY